jgi:hypothetical protein
MQTSLQFIAYLSAPLLETPENTRLFELGAKPVRIIEDFGRNNDQIHVPDK